MRSDSKITNLKIYNLKLSVLKYNTKSRNTWHSRNPWETEKNTLESRSADRAAQSMESSHVVSTSFSWLRARCGRLHGVSGLFRPVGSLFPFLSFHFLPLSFHLFHYSIPFLRVRASVTGRCCGSQRCPWDGVSSYYECSCRIIRQSFQKQNKIPNYYCWKLSSSKRRKDRFRLAGNTEPCWLLDL